MREQEVIDNTIKLLLCDTARITRPCNKYFMIIGEKKHTKDDDTGQWYKNGEPYDFEYIAESAIASGSSLQKLWKGIKVYADICDRGWVAFGEHHGWPPALIKKIKEVEKITPKEVDIMSDTEKTIELLPCPFCNKQPFDTIQYAASGIFVWCDNCNARGPSFGNDRFDLHKRYKGLEDKAIQAWNRRADDDTNNSASG